MRHCWKVCAVLMILANVKSDSTEDQQPYTYSFYNPSALNFNDIYSNNIAPSSGETEGLKDIDDEVFLTTTTTEESYVVNNIQSQFVEFHPEFTTIPPTIPPPRYILNSTFLKETTLKPVRTTTTEDPEDIKVIPIKRNYQRGVLDLLFPETRVKTFRNIFNSIKRLLSHTFRR